MITVLVPPCLERAAKDWLRKHGCRIFNKGTYYKIVFPEGTGEVKLLPRHLEPRYRMICLPDGTRLYRQEMCCRERGPHRLGVLFLPDTRRIDERR